jgi:eukaryotic-like serine/threonine-protein kinase
MIGEQGNIGWASISPDGKTVALDRTDRQTGFRDIWLHDLGRNVESRFTFGTGKGDNRFPVWSPDGSQIAFRARVAMRKATTGSSAEEKLDQALEAPFTESFVLDWSRDGRYLVERVQNPGAGQSLWVLPLVNGKPSGGKLMPYVQNEFTSDFAKISPDGHWLAYQSDETKRLEIFVQSFPTPGEKYQISTAGGYKPVWSRDGKELYFVSLDQKMMAVDIQTSPKFTAGAPISLFATPIGNDGVIRFDVSQDGRFLIPALVNQDAVPINIVTNWEAGFKR